MPAAMASSAAYWIRGLSTTGNSSLGIALVAGKNRVPKPATGKTALRSLIIKILDVDVNFKSYLMGSRYNYNYVLGLPT